MNTRKINIALIRQNYTAFGGAERFVQRALESIQGEHISLTLLTRKWKSTTSFNIKICNPFHLGRTWRDTSFAKCACKHINETNYDLVQSHERISCCDIYRAGDGVHREWLLQKKQTMGGIAGFLQDVSPYHRRVLNAEKALFSSPRLKAAICNSKMVSKEIQKHFHFPESRIHIIYNGVDTDKYNPELRNQHRTVLRKKLGIPEDSPVFLYVGSGFARKGVPILLEAMRSLPGNCFLIVVGKDRKLEKMKRRVARHAMEHRIIFTGPQQDVKPYYGTADALVLPTLYDPFPNVILEAMACGLPVLTSTKCGAAEIINNSYNGYVCEALNKQAIVEHMLSLSDVQHAHEMGKNARTTTEQFTLTHMSEQLMTLYKKLLDEIPET